MLKVKLDIQKFGGGANFTAGITKSAIEAAYEEFHAEIVATNEAIGNIDRVREALTAGWSGKDCEDFLKKFDEHQKSVVKQVSEYDTAVKAAVAKLISEWETFQSGLIS
ncbi:MAG: hypothetical protein IJK67_02805 [Bacilli bacterium]|nr:hypothetical protein [Bacilli bacterium]